MKKFSFLQKLALIACDITAYLLSMFLAVRIRNFLPEILSALTFPKFIQEIYYVPEVLSFVIIYVAVGILGNIYQVRKSFWEDLMRIWRTVIVSALLVYVMLFNLQDSMVWISRTTIALLMIILMFAIPFFRVLFVRLFRKF